MRTRKTSVTMLALTVMAVLAAVCSASLQAKTNGAAPQLEGSWEVTVMPEGGSLIVDITTFMKGGGLVNSDANPQLTTGHGNWVKTGGNEFAVTFIHFLRDPQGVPIGTTKVRAIVELDPKTDTFSGDFRTEVFIPSGNLVQSFCGTVQAKRISVEPLEACP